MPDGEIRLQHIEPMTFAAVRRTVTAATIQTVAMSTPVWTEIEKRGLASADQTVILYHDDADRMRVTRPLGVEVDVGVLVTQRFKGDRMLQCISTPGGQVAHLRHSGDYRMLPVLHADVRAWCLEQGYAITGTHWEHYVLWHEEPTRCLTDIYYEIRQQQN